MTPRNTAPGPAPDPGPAIGTATARAHVAALRAPDLDDPERSAPFADLDRLFGLCLHKTNCGDHPKAHRVA